MKYFFCVVFVVPLFMGCLIGDSMPLPVVEVLPDGSSVMVLSGHTSTIGSIDFSPDSKKILAGTGGNIWIWDSESGKALKRIRGVVNSSSFAWIGTGKKIIEVKRSGGVTVWDAHSGKKLTTLGGGTGVSMSGDTSGKVVVSQDGRKIAMDTPDATIQIWDVDTGKKLQNLEGLHHSHQSLFFSPDGKKLLAKWLRDYVIYDTDTGKELLRLEPKWDVFWSVVFSTDGKKVLVADSGGGKPNITIWDIDSKNVLQTIALSAIDMERVRDIRGVVFSPDRTKIVTIRRIVSDDRREPKERLKGTDSIIQVWDANSGIELHKWEEPSTEFFHVLFSPDGIKFVAEGYTFIGERGNDGRTEKVAIRMGDTDSGLELKKLEWHMGDTFFGFITFSPDGKTVLAKGSRTTRNDKDNDVVFISDVIVQTWILEQ